MCGVHCGHDVGLRRLRTDGVMPPLDLKRAELAARCCFYHHTAIYVCVQHPHRIVLNKMQIWGNSCASSGVDQGRCHACAPATRMPRHACMQLGGAPDAVEGKPKIRFDSTDNRETLFSGEQGCIAGWQPPGPACTAPSGLAGLVLPLHAYGCIVRAHAWYCTHVNAWDCQGRRHVAFPHCCVLRVRMRPPPHLSFAHSAGWLLQRASALPG